MLHSRRRPRLYKDDKHRSQINFEPGTPSPLPAQCKQREPGTSPGAASGGSLLHATDIRQAPLRLPAAPPSSSPALRPSSPATVWRPLLPVPGIPSRPGGSWMDKSQDAAEQGRPPVVPPDSPAPLALCGAPTWLPAVLLLPALLKKRRKRSRRWRWRWRRWRRRRLAVPGQGHGEPAHQRRRPPEQRTALRPGAPSEPRLPLSPPASPAQVSRAPRGAPAPHMLVISIAHDVMASAAEVQRPLPEEQGAPRIPPPLTQPQARRGPWWLCAGRDWLQGRSATRFHPSRERGRRGGGGGGGGAPAAARCCCHSPSQETLHWRGKAACCASSRAPALLQPCEGHARPQKPPLLTVDGRSTWIASRFWADTSLPTGWFSWVAHGLRDVLLPSTAAPSTCFLQKQAVKKTKKNPPPPPPPTLTQTCSWTSERQ